MSKHVKILFEIEGQNEVESVWATPVEDGYQLDNIPFYAREVALDDVVRVTKDADGALRFDGLVRASGHSTIRLWFASADDAQGTRDELRRLGCPSELSDLDRLVAVDVPPDVAYDDIKAKLDASEKAGVFEYEEACLGFL